MSDVKNRNNNSTAASTAATSTTTQHSNLQEYVDSKGHFSLVRNFRLADLITLMNGFCGSMSIFSSANYMITGNSSYMWQGLAFPLAGFIFDAMDGKVARWRNESSMLGQELDSLADSISFGVAPAFCAFALGLRTGLDTFFLTGFICAGIARLARFNATVAIIPKTEKGKSKYFEGLPIPSSLAIVAAMAVLFSKNLIEPAHGVGHGVPFGVFNLGGLYMHKVTLVFISWSFMMVSKTLKIPKL